MKNEMILQGIFSSLSGQHNRWITFQIDKQFSAEDSGKSFFIKYLLYPAGGFQLSMIQYTDPVTVFCSQT